MAGQLADAAIEIAKGSPALFQQVGRARAAKTMGERAKGLLPMAMTALQTAEQRAVEFVEMLIALIQDTTRMKPLQTVEERLEFVAVVIEAVGDKLLHVIDRIGNLPAAGEHAFGNDFGGGAWGCGSQVGNEVADREIDFVADGRNDGNRGVEDGAGDDFFVKSPKVFEAAAAPREENEIDLFFPVIEQADRTGDFLGGTVALHAASGEDDFEAGMTAFDDVENIADRGASRRSNQADALRIAREWALAFGSEEALGLELLLQTLEGDLEGTGALQFDRANQELIVAAGFIDREVALNIEFLAVLKILAVRNQLVAEDDAA